jgi:RNA polymerase sigma-70 factor (ECF subfamily)
MGDQGSGTGSDERTLRVQQLFVAHQNVVRAFIMALVPDFAAADDVLQEVFLTVTRKAAGFREGTNFTAWACAIAKLKVLEWRRQRQAHPQLLSEEAIGSLAASLPEAAIGRERSRALRGCLERLAPRAMEMVRLRYYAGLAPQEVARQLGWKPNAVNVALSKARAFLRKCVERALGFSGG